MEKSVGKKKMLNDFQNREKVDQNTRCIPEVALEKLLKWHHKTNFVKASSWVQEFWAISLDIFFLILCKLKAGQLKDVIIVWNHPVQSEACARFWCHCHCPIKMKWLHMTSQLMEFFLSNQIKACASNIQSIDVCTLSSQLTNQNYEAQLRHHLLTNEI